MRTHYSFFHWMPLAFAMMVVFTAVSCKDDDDFDDKDNITKNQIAYITDADKLAMIRSMKDLDGEGRLYEINDTADYK